MKDLLTRAILCNFLYIKKLQNKNGSAWAAGQGEMFGSRLIIVEKNVK